MKEIDDFVIEIPYVKTDQDQAEIRQASPDGNNKDDWEKACISGFKQRVREYYRKKQHRRCAYCRTVVKTSQSSPEVEHIIPKSDYPDWMYESFNLCMACKSCNTKKSTKKVLDDKANTATLPLLSTDYLLIHPHLDRYSTHINIIDDILYEGITDKGRETIRICELNRYELAADRAEEKLKEDKTLEEQAILAMVNYHGTQLVNVYAKFEERIHELFEEYKQDNE